MNRKANDHEAHDRPQMKKMSNCPPCMQSTSSMRKHAEEAVAHEPTIRRRAQILVLATAQLQRCRRKPEYMCAQPQRALRASRQHARTMMLVSRLPAHAHKDDRSSRAPAGLLGWRPILGPRLPCLRLRCAARGQGGGVQASGHGCRRAACFALFRRCSSNLINRHRCT